MKTAIFIDSVQLTYYRYLAALQKTTVEAVISDALEEHLDISYPIIANTLEPKRRLLPTTAGENSPEASHTAYENMLKNLETLGEASGEKESLPRTDALGMVIQFPLSDA